VWNLNTTHPTSLGVHVFSELLEQLTVTQHRPGDFRLYKVHLLTVLFSLLESLTEN